MRTFSELLRERASQAISAAFGQPYEAEITQSTQLQFGHYQCNSALKIAKQLGKNPREVAQQIVSHFHDPSIDKLEIAGPGFINITLRPEILANRLDAILKSERLAVSLPEHRDKVIVEFSSPNVAKELHVGHLRSTIIGDALARLFEFLGHDVLRLNHIGDWGTQFGMLIAYLREKQPKILSGETPTDLPTLMHWYKESKKLFDADPDFKKRAQLQVVALQGGDREALGAWKRICAISRTGYEEVYQLLDVKIIERGESFYNPYLAEVVADLEKKHLIEISDGAKCIFLDGFTTREGTPLPMIVQKSDGGYNYDTTDMAALRHRVAIEKADRIIIVTDAGQSLHFQMLFAAALKAQYYDPNETQLDHVPFGVVLGPDGKKFKTRSGDTEKLLDLLLEAVKHARTILHERLPDADPIELDHLARAVGIGAVKYADLSCHRVKDYLFSYDRMLKFEGNTAAFLLYAYVRIQSIKQKVGHTTTSQIHLEHPSEISLALHLCQFPETLEMMARDLLPNRLTDYLYTLAEAFNAFYRDCRVEGTPQEASRLRLCEATSRTLETGLGILGLKTVSRM